MDIKQQIKGFENYKLRKVIEEFFYVEYQLFDCAVLLTINFIERVQAHSLDLKPRTICKNIFC